MHLFRSSVIFPIALSLVLTACIGDPWRSVHKQNTLADSSCSISSCAMLSNP